MVSAKTGIIIQARVNASRLPGKVLLPLPQNAGRTLLDQVVANAAAVVPKPEIILATSTNPENDILEQAAVKNGIHFFRGEEQDVLARFYQAARAHKLNTIVRLTADNPFIDPGLLSQTLQQHLLSGVDYTGTVGLPLGANLELFSFRALEQAFREARAAEHREHVTPYIRLNPGLFSLSQQDFTGGEWGKPEWRLTIDNESDYALACAIFLALGPPPLPLARVAAFLTANPALLAINKDNYQKKVFTSLQEELAEAVRLLQFYDLGQAAAILQQHKP
jgi:spore coat polysaccharide biosynthesis protein SpsF